MAKVVLVLPMAKKMFEIRVHGQDKPYHHTRIGLNSRFDTLQAAILLAKLKIFPNEIKARQHIASFYETSLKDIVKTPYIHAHNTSVFAQYTIETKDRSEIQKYLQNHQIPTAIHYPIPINLQPIFSSLNQGPGSFPVAEAAANRVLSLPMHPYLEQQELETIVKLVAKSVQKISELV
jgi:UDP-2-acetamido-2-deoxy-ribo-hexuluronate aminotransferase